MSHPFITPGMHNFNPGVGYDINPNVRVGGLYNSYKEPSFYAAGIVNITDKFRTGLGVISGYKLEGGLVHEGSHTSIIPFIAMEYDLTDHVSVAWFGEVVHLELKF